MACLSIKVLTSLNNTAVSSTLRYMHLVTAMHHTGVPSIECGWSLHWTNTSVHYLRCV